MDSIVEDAIDEAEVQADASGEEPPAQDRPTGEVTDEELKEVLKDLQTNITVVGCGGAGSNTDRKSVV